MGRPLLLVVLLDARLDPAREGVGGDPAAMALPFVIWRAQPEAMGGTVARERTAQVGVLLEP